MSSHLSKGNIKKISERITKDVYNSKCKIQEERIQKAKIQLQLRNSFFGRILIITEQESFKFEEIEEVINSDNDFLTIGITEKAKLYYNPIFIEKLNNGELISIVAHELLHYVFLHHFRLKDRIKELANISQDIVINTLLKNEHYDLPKNTLTANEKDEVKLNINNQDIIIKKCSTKTDEIIYYEIIKQLKNLGYNITISNESIKGIKNKKGQSLEKGIKEIVDDVLDNHFKADITKMSKKEYDKLRQQVEQNVREAFEYSRIKGDTPAGIERMFGELHKEKFNWRELLNKTITNIIPFDKSFNKISKRSYAVGCYMPNTDKEKVDVVVLIDVSGSISKKDLTDFISEVKGILNQFKNRINVTLYTHETNLLEKFDLFNQDDIKKLKIKGGGGTSFDEPIKELIQKVKDIKMLVWLSDGFGDTITINHKFPIVWVLTDDNSQEYCKSNQLNKILVLKDNGKK